MVTVFSLTSKLLFEYPAIFHFSSFWWEASSWQPLYAVPLPRCLKDGGRNFKQFSFSIDHKFSSSINLNHVTLSIEDADSVQAFYN